MKDTELRLISELMRNSRRSDRELAKAVGLSQPTVSRAIKKLQKEGYIAEYTVIPDFRKIGYKIMALTFFKLKPKDVTPEGIEKLRKMGKEMARKYASEAIMVERGLGLDSEGVAISFHETYNAYADFMRFAKQIDFVHVDDTRSFLISLVDSIHYRPLTMSTLAEHMKTLKEQKTN